MVPANRSDHLVLLVQKVPRIRLGPDFRYHHLAQVGPSFQQALKVQVALENLNSPLVRGDPRVQTNQVSLMDLENRRVLVVQGFQVDPTDLAVLRDRVVH